MFRDDKEVILLGDLNKNLLNQTDKKLASFTTSFAFSQLVKHPTRVTDTSRSLFDHIYTNSTENISKVHVSKLTISDHFEIFGNRKLNSNVRKNAYNITTYKSFKNFDESSFKNDVSEVPLAIVTAFDDINEIVEVWNTLILEIVNKHAPIKTLWAKRQYQPERLTTEILECMKERDTCNINDKTEEYRSLQNKVSPLIDKAKRETYTPLPQNKRRRQKRSENNLETFQTVWGR